MISNFSRNLLLTKDDIVKIGDLGEAKHLNNTVGRTYAGTVQYMSPEQSKAGKNVTHNASTDIWYLFRFKCINKVNNSKTRSLIYI